MLAEGNHSMSFFFNASAQRPTALSPAARESKAAGGVTREVAQFIVNTLSTKT